MSSIISRNSPFTQWGVRDDEAEAVLVIGQVDGDEEAVAQGDAFPGNVQQSRNRPRVRPGCGRRLPASMRMV